MTKYYYPTSRLDLSVPNSIPEKDVQRFWSKVDRTESCWLWNSSLDSMGYGSFAIFKSKEYKVVRASRMSFYLSNGLVPKGLCVCHSCDNPKCVKPDHLWLGTISDNSKDMARKGRNPTVFKKGERLGESHFNSKLKNCEVELIKRLLFYNVNRSKISKMFRTTKHTIYRIKHGHQWSHVSGWI